MKAVTDFTANEKQIAMMLVKFFNLQTGTKFKSSSNKNLELAIAALDKLDGDVAELKSRIKEYGCAGGTSLCDCFENIIFEAKSEQPEKEVTDGQVQYSMGILEKAVIELISKTQTERIEEEIMGQVKATIQSYIEQEYGAIERKVTTVIDGKKTPLKGIQHEKFETVLKFVANDEPVFLTGPAGSGKNVICKQVAEALELPFYFTNAVTQEYKLTGFTDAMGNYQETQFYKAFKYGGLFMLDEMDASIPEVLIILNAAIANRYFDFPAPIGYVEASPNFRVIAAGNTTGHGASYEYVGRNQLDAASLDRFAVVSIDYSNAIENSVACGDTDLVKFCRAFRKAANKTGQQVIVSYRAIGRLAKMVQLLTEEEAIETCLVKGMEKDDVNMIVNEIHIDNKYSMALKQLVNKM